MTVRIEIGRRHDLAYLLLPHPVKMALLSRASRQRLDTIDRAFNGRILQSVHHFHRRDEVFRALGRVVRPGRRLFVVEPHRNPRRVARLLRQDLRQYRAPAFGRDERLVPDARRRLGWQHIAGRSPGVRHFAAVLALTARRRDDGHA